MSQLARGAGRAQAEDRRVKGLEDLAESEWQENQLLARSLTDVINGSSGRGTGSLIYPVSGPITSPFGWRVHPILGYKKFHTVLTSASATGRPSTPRTAAP